MFEVKRVYANRKGRYTVLDINTPTMTVRYEDGTVAELNIGIQERIWENIQAEEEIKSANRAARRQRNKEMTFWLKSVSLDAEESLTLPGWRERVTVVDSDAPGFRPDDRIIYYAVDDQVFFALATVTGEASEIVPKGFFYAGDREENLRFYPIDLELRATNLGNAVDVDAVELESEPDFKSLLSRPDTYLQISEDDFELLADLLGELIEEEDEDVFDEEEEEDFEE